LKVSKYALPVTTTPDAKGIFPESDAMRAFRFDIMGSTRRTWDFYRG